MLTKEALQKISPLTAEKLIDLYLLNINQTMDEFEINTRFRQAAFIAQILHETGGLRYMKEIWGPTDTQKRYEGRKDLGNTQIGDFSL
jgi:putative chitinase